MSRKDRIKVEDSSKNHPVFNPVLPGIDRRTIGGRRYAEILEQILGAIGAPSSSQIMVARQASGLAHWCELELAKLTRGEPFDISTFITASNSLARMIESLGINVAERPDPFASLGLGHMFAARA